MTPPLDSLASGLRARAEVPLGQCAGDGSKADEADFGAELVRLEGRPGVQEGERDAMRTEADRPEPDPTPGSGAEPQPDRVSLAEVAGSLPSILQALFALVPGLGTSGDVAGLAAKPGAAANAEADAAGGTSARIGADPAGPPPIASRLSVPTGTPTTDELSVQSLPTTGPRAGVANSARAVDAGWSEPSGLAVVERETHFAPVRLPAVPGTSAAAPPPGDPVADAMAAASGLPASPTSSAGRSSTGPDRAATPGRGDQAAAGESRPALAPVAAARTGPAVEPAAPAIESPMGARRAGSPADGPAGREPGAPATETATAAKAPPAGLGTVGLPPATLRQIADAVVAQASALPDGSTGVAPGMALVAGPTRLLTLQLRPAELGTVLVRMRLQDGRLDMDIRASREETAGLLRRDESLLSGLLRSAGYQSEISGIHAGAEPRAEPGPGAGVAFNFGGREGAPSGQPGRREATPGSADAPARKDPGHAPLPDRRDPGAVYL